MALDELNFPFPPPLRFCRGHEALCLHAVVAELGQDRAVGVVQESRATQGLDACDGLQSAAADVNQHVLTQPLRHGVRVASKRLHYFLPLLGSDREFQVPAGVHTAGPPAQGDPLRGQRQSFGIKIDRIQLYVGGLPNVVDPAD